MQTGRHPLPIAPLPSLLVCVEGGVGEALPLVLHEEFAVPHADVIDLVARAAPVHPLPLLRGLLALPATTAAEEGWTPWTWDGTPWGWHRSQNSSQIPGQSPNNLWSCHRARQRCHIATSCRCPPRTSSFSFWVLSAFLFNEGSCRAQREGSEPVLANSSEHGARGIWQGCFITVLMALYPKFRHF